MSLPQEIQIKFDTMAANPRTMHDICVHLANGGDMISLCEVWGIPYGYVVEWINESDQRNELYQRAIRAQGHWAIERVMKELKTMAMLDFSKAYDQSGKLLHPSEMPEDIRRAIKSIDVTEEFEGVGKDKELVGYTKRVQFWDKPKALEMIGRKFAMFVDRLRVDVKDKSLEDLVDESWRADAINAETIQTNPDTQSGPPTPGERPRLLSDKGSTPPDLPSSEAPTRVSGSQPIPDTDKKYPGLKPSSSEKD